MKTWIEAIVFSALAILVLVAGFALSASEGGQAGGQGGDSMISITAAPTTVAALVKSWERPVDVPLQPVAELSPVDAPSATLPQAVQFELAQAPELPSQLHLFQPKEQEELVLETAAPAAPPEPEPERAEKPTPEPEPEIKEAVRAEQTSAGRAEQRSAGSGGRSEAGTNGRAEVATNSSGERQKLLNIWGSKVRSAVSRRKRTPRGVKAVTAVVQFTVSRDGRLLSHKIVKSSGVAEADKAALQAVRSVKRFPKAPKKLQLNQYSFTLPLKFL